jgi:hypothetical protein
LASSANHFSEADDWSFDQAYSALGYEFRIRSTEPQVAFLLHRLLAHFAQEGGEDLPAYSLFARGGQEGGFQLNMPKGWIREARKAIDLQEFILWDVYMEAIKSCGDYLALHASAASLDGVGMVFPGRQNAGKSTLVAGLVSSGFGYLTDEAALVDLASGFLHPFPKGLVLAHDSVRAIPDLMNRLPEELRDRPSSQYHVAPDEVRVDAIGEPCPLRLVIFPRYQESGTTAAESIPRAEGLMTLLEDSFNFMTLGDPAFRLAAELSRELHFYRLTVSDLKDAAGVVRQLVGSVTQAT